MKLKNVEANSDAEIKSMFTMFDFDRNGKVGVTDLARISKIVNGEEASLDYIQELINWGDMDRDGQLNYDEFYHVITKYESVIDPRSRRVRE